MNYSHAFSYVFEDKNWLSKILIAGLISLIPIVGQFYLLGWMIEIIRRVKAGRIDILPATHFSYFLTLGLKMFVVTLIYSIPLIIVTGVFSYTTRQNSYDGSTVTIVVTSMGFFGSLISLLVHIATAFLVSYGFIKLAETDQIKACLNFSDAFDTIKGNLSTFIIVELLSIVASIIASAGTILCFIGLIFTMPYGTAITGHLLGQLWNSIELSKSQNGSYKGSVNEKTEDIIEEAPFTRVQDIEQHIMPENPVITVEPAAAVEETAPAPEAAAPDVEATAPAAEETVPEAKEEDAQHTDEQPEASDNGSDNDLPSFE